MLLIKFLNATVRRAVNTILNTYGGITFGVGAVLILVAVFLSWRAPMIIGKKAGEKVTVDINMRDTGRPAHDTRPPSTEREKKRPRDVYSDDSIYTESSSDNRRWNRRKKPSQESASGLESDTSLSMSLVPGDSEASSVAPGASEEGGSSIAEGKTIVSDQAPFNTDLAFGALAES